jgi:hypothetical protein
MTSIASEPSGVPDRRQQLQPLPDRVLLTAATIRAWRKAGYHISEHRKASWLYLLARRDGESAVYKIVGPLFHSQTVVYEGWRVA